MAMSALPWNPSGVEDESKDRHATLAQLEALLFESDSEGSEDSLSDHAIEEFANEIKIEEIDSESTAVRMRVTGAAVHA